VSLLPLISTFGAVPPVAILVGNREHTHLGNSFPLPNGSQGNDLAGGALAGDFCIAHYYRDRNIVGGAGGWTSFTFGYDGKVSYKLLESDDLAPGAITLSDNSPLALMVWRGPRSIGASPRSTLSTSGTTSYSMPGFAKTPGAAGIVGVGNGALDAPSFRVGIFERMSRGVSTGLGFGLGSKLNAYVDGTPFPIGTETTAGIECRIYELFF
jgi:hypothetical protein